MAKSSTSEIIASLDIGTSKIVALIAEINGDNELKIIGVGTETSRGLKKGVVVNIESTVDSIGKAIKQAERIAECEINTVFAGIAGSHVRSYDGHGFVRINEGEVSQEDIDGAVDASIAMKIPSEERILHVLPKDFVIDGQDGIAEPIGMSGIRLEADVHIVTISRTAEENIVKSPMVGVAYLSADPSSAAYVKIGQHVKAGDTLLLIEAMKTFNEIKAPKSGVIKKILALNSQPVEYGDHLIIFE